MRAMPPSDAPAAERLQPENPGTPRQVRRSAVERLAADRAKYVRGVPAAEGCGVNAAAAQESAPDAPARAQAPVVRRAIARRPLRPDSLVIYRQKCEFVRTPGTDGSRGSLGKKLLPVPGKDRVPASADTQGVGEESGARGRNVGTAPARPGPVETPSAPSAAAPAPSAPSAASQSVAPAPPGLELRVARRRGLQRSQSDLSSLSSTAKAEYDAFFQYCGLDPDVVEALGRENFSASSDCVALKVRSVSVATSDSGFSRRSDDDGEDGLSGALKEQGPSATSVIERNARIIKWLYTCRKAREGPGQGLQGPA
ncbi:protein FAM110C [Ochotona princeps]|uniref:protein FAM110C n=1 Tax=Ochotona princeps TaxID=9978 RepID=UPI0027153921|nr:protein FAM110C [Ochotona princeps]